MNFFKWCYSYFKPYKILIVTPEKQYTVELYKGNISTLYTLPDIGIRGQTFNAVWMDEETPSRRGR